MFKLTSIKSVITLGLFFIIGFSSMGNAETTVSAEVQYIFNTFSFLVCGFLVMWMAAGFAMLEAGLVRSKNTTEILTKNVALYAIACIMYSICYQSRFD